MLNTDSVLLDLDAFADQEVDTIKTEETFGFNLKLGQISTETWFAIEKEGKKLKEKRKEYDLKKVTETMVKVCMIILGPFNTELTKNHLFKLPFQKLEYLTRMLADHVKKKFQGMANGRSQQKKDTDTKGSA